MSTSNLSMENRDISRDEATTGFLSTETKASQIDAKAPLHQRWPSPRVFYSTLAILSIGILLLSAKILSMRYHNLENANLSSPALLDMSPSEASPCGNDANTARSLGCNFDPLTFAWLPPQCYNYNLTAEFLQLQDWQWWRQREDGSRRQLSLINVMQGSDETLYVTWDYHRQHCAYLWLKMHQAIMEGAPIDGVAMLDIITGVCDGVLRSKRDLNDTSVPGYIRYPSCKVY